jgi:hypothetical protein
MKTLSIPFTKSFSLTFPKPKGIFKYLIIINFSINCLLFFLVIYNFIYFNKLLNLRQNLQKDVVQLSKNIDNLVQQIKDVESESKIQEFVTNQNLIKVTPSQIKYLKISPESLVQNQ